MHQSPVILSISLLDYCWAFPSEAHFSCMAPISEDSHNTNFVSGLMAFFSLFLLRASAQGLDFPCPGPSPFLTSQLTERATISLLSLDARLKWYQHLASHFPLESKYSLRKGLSHQVFSIRLYSLSFPVVGGAFAHIICFAEEV